MRRAIQSCVLMWIAVASTMPLDVKWERLAHRAVNRTCRRAVVAALIRHRGRLALIAHRGQPRRVWIVLRDRQAALIGRHVRQAAEAVEIALHVATAATVVAELVTWNGADRSTKFHQQERRRGFGSCVFFAGARFSILSWRKSEK